MILGDKGHLSNKDSYYYLTKIIWENTKYIVLLHLSEQNNTEELALNSLKDSLICSQILAHRSEFSKPGLKVFSDNRW